MSEDKMSEPTFSVSMNFNKVHLNSWIDKRRLDDGSYELIGMGRRTEIDATTGAVVSDKIEPTGLRGWAPHDAFGERRTLRQWWRGLVTPND